MHEQRCEFGPDQMARAHVNWTVHWSDATVRAGTSSDSDSTHW
jgi:hypothetical protein